MGAGVHLPRALTALAMVLATGCIDFVAPDEPQIGGPAIFQATLRVADDGAVRIVGELEPGIDEDGFRRTVASEPMIALDDSIPPRSIEADGTRSYLEERTDDPAVTAGPLSLRAPVVLGVDPPPALRWTGLLRLDPDTIRLEPAADLLLHTLTAGMDEPEPLNSSWNLVLRRGDAVFRIGGDGPPPALLDVPRRWLPDSPDPMITADLTWVRSHTASPQATSYIGVFSVAVALHWTVVAASGPRPVRTGGGG